MFHPVPFEYHDLIVDRRDPRPARFAELMAVRNNRRRGLRWGRR
jgi:hypothetical protein